MIYQLMQEIIKILANQDLQDKINGIYFTVPANTKFPYIYIGEFLSKDISTKDHLKTLIQFKLLIYSRDKNDKNILSLSDEIKSLFRAQNKNFYKIIDEKLTCQNDGITHQITLNLKTIFFGKREFNYVE